MTHNEYLGVSVVLNQLEVVSSLPVILFFVNANVFKVLLGHLDHASFVFHVEGSVSHDEMVQDFDLLELVSQIF